MSRNREEVAMTIYDIIGNYLGLSQRLPYLELFFHMLFSYHIKKILFQALNDISI